MRMLRAGMIAAAGSTTATQWLASSLAVPGNVAFSRTGPALYLTGTPFSSAVYASAATDVPRFERLPSGSIGWLGEGQATNLNPYSYDLTNTTGWNIVNAATRTINQPGLLGAANTATVITDSNAAARAGVSIFGIAIPTAVSTWIGRMWILKDATTSRFPEADYVLNTTHSQVWTEINTSTGATADKGGPGTIAPTVYARDRGLFWEWGFFGVKPGTDTQIDFQILAASADAAAGLGGTQNTATGSVTIGAVEFILGSVVPTSPLPLSNGAAMTRNAELASQTVTAGSGFAVQFNCRTAAAKSGDQYLWTRDDGSSANRVHIRRNSSGAIVLDICTSSSLTSITGATVADNTEAKIAVSLATNSSNLCVNNTLATRNTTKALPSGLTTERFFTDHNSTNHWQGHIISGWFGPTDLAPTNDAGLQALNV